jgi:hypothetical protein
MVARREGQKLVEKEDGGTAAGLSQKPVGRARTGERSQKPIPLRPGPFDLTDHGLLWHLEEDGTRRLYVSNVCVLADVG